MKVFSVVPVFFLAVLTATAQTNLTAGAQTNLLASPARSMSLQDCIAEALQHNLDLQIQRYNPQISLYNLNADYTGYDPTFSLSGSHTYNDTGGTFQNGQRVSAQQINEDSFSSAFNGGTPWGMTYNLGGNVQSTKGDQFGTISNIFIQSPLQSSYGQVGALTLDAAVAEKFLD